MKAEDWIETPAIIIDMEKVRANLKDMSETVLKCGCTLRPHIKTHKNAELARLQLEFGAKGITCAKISEAEVMADAGINDIFIAYPLVGEFRLARAMTLAARIKLYLGVDSIETAAMLSNAAQKAGLNIEVRLEVDTGLKRTGIPYEEAISTAKQIAAMPGLMLHGIYTFRGLLLNGEPTTENRAAGHQEGELLTKLASALRENGIDIRDVSGGSSPTGKFVAEVDGVTEIRPGTYIFQDYMQVQEGVCSLKDCAGYVLATVVSTPSEDYAIIDGGSKTFATDFRIGEPPYAYEGYGVVVGHEELVLSRLNEEHGIITARFGHTGLTVGQRIKIIPVHICSTVNLHNTFWFNENNVFRKARVDARGMLV